jgi:hypothetical protein
MREALGLVGLALLVPVVVGLLVAGWWAFRYMARGRF